MAILGHELNAGVHIMIILPSKVVILYINYTTCEPMNTCKRGLRVQYFIYVIYTDPLLRTYALSPKEFEFMCVRESSKYLINTV